MVNKMDKHELLNQDIDSKKRIEQIKIEPNNTILYIGDSITDVNRDRENDEDIGHGYHTLVDANLLHKYPVYDLIIYNQVIGVDKVIDLKKRWKNDCLELNLDVVSILIGINDVSQIMDGESKVVVEDLAKFVEDSRYLLKSLA